MVDPDGNEAALYSCVEDMEKARFERKTAINEAENKEYENYLVAKASAAKNVVAEWYYTGLAVINSFVETDEKKRQDSIALSAATMSSGLSKVVSVEANAVKAVIRDAKGIKFTQDSVKTTFKDGRSVQALSDELKSGKVNPKDIEPIRVFEKNGELHSLDNRRLKAAKDAGKPISTVQATKKQVNKQTAPRPKGSGKTESLNDVPYRGQSKKK